MQNKVQYTLYWLVVYTACNATYNSADVIEKGKKDGNVQIKKSQIKNEKCRRDKKTKWKMRW